MAPMNQRSVAISHAQSLLWLALFAAIALGVTNLVELTLIDFVHGNPHRPQSNAVVMMVVFTPVFGIAAAIGTLLVFTLPQLFQVALIVNLGRMFGDRARFASLLVLPLTAILTWYCYDYLTPTDFNLGINVGPDWTPFEHGLSVLRFLLSLAAQAPVTLFNFLYLNARLRGTSKISILVASLAIAITFGLINGYSKAQNQLQFL
jgi:hypothetical protein